MARRLSVYFFATFVFALQGSIVATLIYAALLLLLRVGADTPQFNFDFIVGTCFYVLAVCFASCIFAFLLSIVLKLTVRLQLSKWEGYVFVALAAILANLCAVVLAGASFSRLHLAIYLASVISIFFGSKLYASVWKKLEALAYPASRD